MQLTEDTGKGVEHAASGVSTLIKTGERNRWAISLIVSVAFNIIQLVYGFKQSDKIMEIQQLNTKQAQDMQLETQRLLFLLSKNKIPDTSNIYDHGN